MIRCVKEKQLNTNRNWLFQLTIKKENFWRVLPRLLTPSGGDIVFGVIAKDGKPIALKAIASFNSDADILKLRDIIRAHVGPKIFGIDFHPIELTSGGWILIVRVPHDAVIRVYDETGNVIKTHEHIRDFKER